MDVQITGLTRVRNPRPNRAGDTIIAYFDVKVEWLRMDGAALVKLASHGQLTCWEPLEPGEKPYRRRVRMDGEVRQAVAEAALPIFESLGGEV